MCLKPLKGEPLVEYAELIAEVRENYSAAFEAMTLFLTVVTAYLVVAYTVGRELSKFQMFLTTGLFVVFALTFTIGAYGFIERAHYLQTRWGEETYSGLNIYFAYWTGSIQLVGIIGSLYFMYGAQREAGT